VFGMPTPFTSKGTLTPMCRFVDSPHAAPDHVLRGRSRTGGSA
jgi:hypothetical protein